MEKIKITYIVSDIDRFIGFEWVATNLNKDIFDISFILLNANDSFLEKFLLEKNIPVCRIIYQGKKDIIKAFFGVRKALKQFQTNIVHCHFFDACFIGLLAAKSLFIKKRIYTRHYSTLHYDYFGGNGVKYDKLFNYLATNIVAISEIVAEVLIKRESVKETKISLIYHGIDVKDYTNISFEDIENIKNKYNNTRNFPVIGVIARYSELKGLQYIIPAFKKLLNDYPNAKLILANAHGDYATEIKYLLKDIPTENYQEIKFERQGNLLYSLFDIYLHTPVDKYIEAFGLTYIEALISKVPSIFTLSGIASNFIQHEKNALVVPYKDIQAIYEAIIKILEDKNLTETLKNNGYEDVKKGFSLDIYIKKLEELYQ